MPGGINALSVCCLGHGVAERFSGWMAEIPMSQSTKSHRILMISTDTALSEAVVRRLGRLGYPVSHAIDGLEGIRRWRRWAPDLIVIGEDLPVIDGWSALRHIRFEDKRAVILMVCAASDRKARENCRRFGGDGIASKEEGAAHLEQRILQLLADAGSQSGLRLERELYRFGENRVDFARRIAQCRVGTIQLTEQEARLLKLLVRHRGKPLSRSRILELGWGYRPDVATRTVDNFMVRLRKYFEKDPRHPIYFRSLRSVGYVFVDEPDGDERP